MSLLVSWLFGTDATETPLLATSPAQQFRVTQSELDEVRARLRHVSATVQPKTYESRVPHVAELERLHARFARQQRAFADGAHRRRASM